MRKVENKIIKDSEKYAKENKIKLNPNKKIVEAIAKGLAKNEEKFGYRYCPCRIERIKENICPCKWNKEGIEEKGRCHCGNFVKKA